MGNMLEKAAQISQKFLTNFLSEIEKDPELKRGIERAKQRLIDNTPLSSIYKGLQLSDYLISNSLKDYCSDPRPGSAVDRFFEKTFDIPQYYGGIRDPNIRPLLDKLSNSFFRLTRLDRLPVFREYKVIKRLEDKAIPEIFKRLFNFKELESVTKEAEETLKQLKETLIQSEPGWIDKEITLEDVRMVETESIGVKNLKKTVKCTFEMTAVLSGYENGKKRNVRQSFDCSFDFVDKGGEWVVSSFSFTPFTL